MKDNNKKTNTGLQTIPKKEKSTGIENHKKAATHFEAAAKSHLDALKHHSSGNHDKAAKSTVEAYGHSIIANKAQKKDLKYHIQKE